MEEKKTIWRQISYFYLLETPECSDLWSEMNGQGGLGTCPHVKFFRLQKPRPVVGVIHFHNAFCEENHISNGKTECLRVELNSPSSHALSKFTMHRGRALALCQCSRYVLKLVLFRVFVPYSRRHLRRSCRWCALQICGMSRKQFAPRRC